MYLIGIFQGSLNVVCPIVHMWRTCHYLSFIAHVRTTHFYNSFIKEFSSSSLRGSWHFAHTYYECGIHRNGSYTCEHMQLLSHLFKRDAHISFFFTHITLRLLYWAILLHHSLSLFSRHLPSFIILTRGFLCFPLINPCLHCSTILAYTLGFFLSHGNIVSHLTYLDFFFSLLYFIVSFIVDIGFWSMPKREIVDMRFFSSKELVMEQSLFFHWC